MNTEPLAQTANTIVVKYSDKSFLAGGLSLVFAGIVLLLEFLSLTKFNFQLPVLIIVDLLFVAMIVSGILMILSGHLTILTFDKAQGKIFVTPKGLFRKNRTLTVSSVDCIALHKIWRFMGKTPGLHNQQLFLILKDETRIALKSETAETTTTVEEETAFGTQIAQFINVPFRQMGPS